MLVRGEDEVELAQVNGGTERTEDREGHRIGPAAVIEKQAEARIELLAQPDHMVELGTPLADRQSLPNALAARHGDDRLLGRTGLELGLGSPEIGQAALRLFELAPRIAVHELRIFEVYE